MLDLGGGGGGGNPNLKDLDRYSVIPYKRSIAGIQMLLFALRRSSFYLADRLKAVVARGEGRKKKNIIKIKDTCRCDVCGRTQSTCLPCDFDAHSIADRSRE